MKSTRKSKGGKIRITDQDNNVITDENLKVGESSGLEKTKTKRKLSKMMTKKMDGPTDVKGGP